MAITSSGVGSGLDISGIISQLMVVEQQPLTVLAKKETGLQAKLSALGSLKGALSQFQTSVKALTDPAKFNQISSTISDATIATVSTSSSAQLGRFNLEVSQLAVANKIKSGLFTKTTDVVGTGKLTIQLGTYANGTFSVNPDKTAMTVTIDSNKNTLAGVRDSINAANGSVTASIVNDGSGNRLVLSSKDTGVANSIKITVEDGDFGNTDTSGLSQLAYDPAAAQGSGKNLTELQAAKNALMKIDGLDVSKPSNVVSDAVEGVTLSLTKVTTTPVSVNVSRSSSTISAAVQDFVKSYNDLTKSLTDLGHFSYNADTKVKDAGALQGENALRSVQSQLRSVLGGVLGDGGSYSRLSDVGIKFNKDGTLALDSTKLTTAIDKDFAKVASLFSANAVPTDSKVSYVSATEATKAGTYAVNITRLATKGTLNSSALSLPYTYVASNNATQGITLGGVTSPISLTPGSYADTTAFAAAIKSGIEANSALYSSGDSVTVAYNNTSGKFDISRTRGGTTDTMSLDFSPKPFQVDANNNTFKLKVDGVQSETITLSQGVYSGADLAAELQSRINSDSLLKAGSVATTVTWNSTANRLEFSSNRYGSASKMEVASLGTNTGAFLGISAGPGIDGQDVAGQIGGTVTQGVFTGTAVTSPITLGAGDNSLQLKIDGVQSSVLLPADAGTYTGAQMASLLQTKINEDSALRAAGVSVAVGWNVSTGKFEIASNRYGAASSVEVTSVGSGLATALGISAGVGVSGTATGGTAATGNGQALTATEGSAIGLKLNIDGTTSGNRGSITFNRGFAYQLDKLLDSMLSKTGAIASRETGLNANIKTITSDRDTLNRRLVDIEARYRKQYTALDLALSQMKQTSNSLTTQLANLASASKSS